MPTDFIKKSLRILLSRQTNILSAAFVIMATIIFSQLLGLVRQRLLVGIFGASDILGVYLASSRLPDFLFQLTIAGALSSAFIPIFSNYLEKGKEKDAYRVGSTFLMLSSVIFLFLSIILFIFSKESSSLMAPGFSQEQIELMAGLMRIIIIGEFLFIIGSFLSAVLQSYNHFFVPGIAAALYNLGIIIGIVLLAPVLGIYSAAFGVILGAFIFILVQLPQVRAVGFSFIPSFSIKASGVLDIFKLMWPRTISIGVFQLGTIAIVTLVSFLQSPGRSYVIFDYAQTLAFAPVVLFGQAIAQAAFPILSREKDKLEDFKTTFLTSFNQIIYLILPVSVLFLVLRIPVVRLIYGAAQFDWQATVLTGRTLAFFSISLFAQALVYLISRGFYALHDTKTPLAIGAVTTVIMIGLGALFTLIYKQGIESIAIAYSIASIINFAALFIILDIKVGGFQKFTLALSLIKIFIATIFMGIALYVPIKLLDQLVFDTTKTINLLLLTGISSAIGIGIYLFLTWLLNVKEAFTFLLIFRKIGNLPRGKAGWREILGKSEEVIDGTQLNKI